MNFEEVAIKTQNLSRCFGERVAVNNLNIEIKKGGIFSLLGTNGAGKTTTIKMLSCLLKPTSGSASVMDFNLAEHSQKIKNIIGVSPQETAIAAHLNSMENLMLMGGVSGLKNGESKKRAIELMALLGIENRKDQARKLSGGLQRRLSIAMALMCDPQILFLDEPTLGLDPHARKMVWNYIEKLKTKKTILLTTHYLEEADSLADTIAIMDEGKIIEMGTSETLKKKYNAKQTMEVSSTNISQLLTEQLQQKGYEVVRTTKGLEVSATTIDFYAVVGLLKQNDVQISGIEMKEPTLDDVFLHLTNKEGKL
jgi:ABC-2 type transport system ATP-binding protein